MIKGLIGIALACVALAGCAAQPKQEQTSLQVQAYQSKEFEADKGMAFAAVISVFQDLGYIVQSADKETGFITAASPAGNKTSFWEGFAGVATSGQTKATAFVEQVRPGFTTVRLNFVDTKQKSSAYGQSAQRDAPITDPKPYQVALGKIEDAIFIRSGMKGS